MTFDDEIDNLILPEIPNIPDKLPDDYEWIKENIKQWKIKVAIPAKLVNEKHFDALCRSYPNAISKERLLIYCKMYYFFAVVDDRNDIGFNDTIIESNDFYNCLEMYYNLIIEDIMDYSRINESNSYEAKLFRDIWIEMLPDLSDKLSNRIVNTICDYFKMSKHIQLNYRRLDKYIGLEKYMSYRRVDAELLQMFLFAEYLLGNEFNDEMRSNRDYKELIGLCMNRIIIANDILGFKAELSNGDIMNYCIAYLYDKQCSLQEAVDNAFIYLTEIDVKYQNCIDRCLKYNDSLFREFITICQCMSHGVFGWYNETTRYNLVTKSKLLEIENKIKRNHTTNSYITVSEVIGEQNAKLYEFFD